jgi:hypothetical protein
MTDAWYPFLAMIGIFIFAIGVRLGFELATRSWKANADTYIGKDGMKVIHIGFYQNRIVTDYIDYLEKRKVGIGPQ